MKVALIGALGQLGQDIQRSVPSGVDLYPLTHQEIEIADRESVFQCLGGEQKFQVIINTAGFIQTERCEEEPEKAFLVNAVGVKNLVDVAWEIGAILLHVSTDYVFDGKKMESREPYTEEDFPNPINVYGLSKYAGELFVRNSLEKFYIIRVASLYGKAGASGKGGNFVYTILRKAKKGEPLRVIEDMYISPTYTWDAAQKIWEIICQAKPYGVYHVTNQGICSWYDFAKKILECAGISASIEPISHREYKTKVRRPLWSPLTSVKGVTMRAWEEALSDFIREVRENI